MMVTVPVSAGELIDKIIILEIKAARIVDPKKKSHIDAELVLLRRAASSSRVASSEIADLADELRLINIAIWDAEEGVRARDASGDFGPGFVELARSIYRKNDRRAAVKRRINVALGSAVVEEKSYP